MACLVIAYLSPLSGCGDGRSDAGDGGVAQAGAGGTGSPSLPQTLSDTGLYAAGSRSEVAAGVSAYEPRYGLWADGADKQRWLYLPAQSQIDTSDMDHWEFPVGTKAWKEFSRGGRKLETRLLWKTNENWLRFAFAWDDSQAEAKLVANRGASDVLHTTHDIPSRTACDECHEGAPDRLLGVSAIQLAHDAIQLAEDEPGLNLRQLVEAGKLSHPPADPSDFRLPDTLAWNALGYLHANCGNCHAPTSTTWGRLDLDLWLRSMELAAPDITRSYSSTLGARVTEASDALDLRVAPGEPDASGLLFRMTLRDDKKAMPPLASESVDAEGVALIRAWIESL